MEKLSKIRIDPSQRSIFNLGSPKADLIFKIIDEFQRKTKKIKDLLKLSYDKTIIWVHLGKTM
jgi:hypothetical protein